MASSLVVMSHNPACMCTTKEKHFSLQKTHLKKSCLVSNSAHGSIYRVKRIQSIKVTTFLSGGGIWALHMPPSTHFVSNLHVTKDFFWSNYEIWILFHPITLLGEVISFTEWHLIKQHCSTAPSVESDACNVQKKKKTATRFCSEHEAANCDTVSQAELCEDQQPLV